MDSEACANPRCLNGANCPGHPWRKSELGELAKLETMSRDMNDAAHRGSGFRQAREFFYRPASPEGEKGKARAALVLREALREAERDARVFGFGVLRREHDGTIIRVDPRTVTLTEAD
jgi:hypothetical protein